MLPNCPPSDLTCPRCGRTLAEKNTNPEHLCSLCQNDLNYHSPNSAKLAEWHAANKPTITRPAKDLEYGGGGTARGYVRRASAKLAKLAKLPDPRAVPISYLLACHRELEHRRKEAEAVIKALT